MNRNTAMILTIAAAVLCGCPGIFLCGFGAWTATGNMPYTTTVNGVSNQGMLPSSVGFVMLCMALIFIAIPIVVGVVTLRKKPEEAPVSNEPLPPAS